MGRLLLLFTLIFSPLSAHSAQAVKTITSGSEIKLGLLKPVETYLIRAYSRIGYRVNFIGLSSARGVKLAESGEIDALTIKAKGVADNLSQMRMIPVKLLEAEIILYCQMEVVCNMDILNSPEVIIGTITGINMTSLFMNDKRASIYQVTSGEQLIEMFSKKRLDYIIAFETVGVNLFNFEMNIDAIKLPLKKIAGYHLIHQKHADIIPSLTESLSRTIEEQGAISIAVQELVTETMSEQ